MGSAWAPVSSGRRMDTNHCRPGTLRTKPKRDNISILAIGTQTQIAQALEAGTIDAAVLSPALSSQLRAEGLLSPIRSLPRQHLRFSNALAVTATYLQQSPEVVEKVVAALIESTAFSLSRAITESCV